MDQQRDPLSPGLYIVATPIGNLGDITMRAVSVLNACDAVACEDTRVTGKLMHHLGIRKRLIRHDDHAGDNARDGLLALAETGPVALVSDAGTPLISDPGYRLVVEARERGIAVVTVPGPSAVIAGLSISGLPTDRFLFAGFLPPKDKARRDVLTELAGVPSSLVFYETAPRLGPSLVAIGELLPGRTIAVGRELTKLHEECRSGTAEELIAHYEAHPPRGEIVLMIGPPVATAAEDLDIDALLVEALKADKPSQAAAKLAKAHGLDRKMLYARAMELK
ncbi:16S rRNA (cytidine(1402)-2'-O)-methyltransferase [Croceicoccus mobilis]|uniref:Ribosomal RNA small subunit methyltransferase I n=1 Tax=Croceicoccus mobilis TaxID=1703339 RepID=A0A917DRD8_9SPHN|nr:16S rRNA (cytidine(1402)-2'-O)-methyltransferase [Croceicoccus mobilis]GGD63803.1 ribosomal RNA small subunit methyltransferase I [Croceicoccus mobilis]